MYSLLQADRGAKNCFHIQVKIERMAEYLLDRRREGLDWRIWIQRAQTFGSQRQSSKARQTKYRPYALAMTSSGDIILSPRNADSKTVMKLRADGTECALLNVSPSWSLGVSVTDDDDILVCASGGRVMRCNGDGGNVRQIYDGKKDDTARYAIELPDSNICIADGAHKALVIIDKTGKILKQINKPLGVQNFSPRGLACDSIEKKKEKKKEIWPSPMTKPPITTENSKTKGQHTNATKNFDYTTIADRLRTVSWSNKSSNWCG